MGSRVRLTDGQVQPWLAATNPGAIWCPSGCIGRLEGKEGGASGPPDRQQLALQDPEVLCWPEAAPLALSRIGGLAASPGLWGTALPLQLQ